MPKVSVVTPTYNMAHYLPQALDSALGQDYPDMEIIVLDDGSTDNTAEVIERYEGRVRYVPVQHIGLACAYNRLTALSTGDYIQVLDADDALLPGALSRSVAALEKYPSAGFAYAAATVIDQDGRPYGRRLAPEWIARAGLATSKEAFRALLSGCHVTHSTAMIRRSVLEDVGPYQAESVPGEDWDMWLRIVSRYDMFYVSETGALYRTHPASITSSYRCDDVYRSHRYTIERIFADPKFRYASMRGYAFACLHRTVATVAARGRNRRAFVSHFSSAVRHRPGILGERATGTAVLEGAKTLFPRQVLAAGKSVRNALASTGSGAHA